MTIIGAELPDRSFTWKDSNGAVIDFSSGWTFTATIGIPGRAGVLTKSGGITGAATAPNVTIAWGVDELDTLTAGTWVIELDATRTSDGKNRKAQFLLPIAARIT